MEISSASIWALVIIVFLNTLFVAGLAVALFLIHKKLEEALSKSEPLLQRAAETLSRVDETTEQLQVKVDHALAKTTELVDKVSERVDTTTAIAEEAVTEPLIGAASIMAGIQKGLRTYRAQASDKGEHS